MVDAMDAETVDLFLTVMLVYVGLGIAAGIVSAVFYKRIRWLGPALFGGLTACLAVALALMRALSLVLVVGMVLCLAWLFALIRVAERARQKRRARLAATRARASMDTSQ